MAAPDNGLFVGYRTLARLLAIPHSRTRRALESGHLTYLYSRWANAALACRSGRLYRHILLDERTLAWCRPYARFVPLREIDCPYASHGDILEAGGAGLLAVRYNPRRDADELRLDPCWLRWAGARRPAADRRAIVQHQASVRTPEDLERQARRDSRLTPSAYRLLVDLRDQAGPGGVCPVSDAQIAGVFEAAERTVRRWVHQLEATGYVERVNVGAERAIRLCTGER